MILSCTSADIFSIQVVWIGFNPLGRSKPSDIGFIWNAQTFVVIMTRVHVRYFNVLIEDIWIFSLHLLFELAPDFWAIVVDL